MKSSTILGLAILALGVGCSSGGAGGVPGGNDVAGAFGSKGGSAPVLNVPSPAPPSSSGGQTTVDAGGGGQNDTGTTQEDTGGGGGGGDRCSRTSKCPSDPAPSADSIASCQAALDSSCGTEYGALIDCFATNQVCADDGTTDSSATMAACNSQLNAYSACAGG